MTIIIFQWVGMVFCSAIVLCATAIVVSATSDYIARNEGLTRFVFRLMFGRKFAKAYMYQIASRKRIQSMAKSQADYYMKEIEELKKQLEDKGGEV